LYESYFTDDFRKNFKKLTKKDGKLKEHLKSRIEELKAEKPQNLVQYIADLKGKWKMRVGNYRVPFAYCEDCRDNNYEHLNQCMDCDSKNNNAIVFFDVFHRSKGYDN